MAKIENDAVCVFCPRTPPPGATYYCSPCEVTCCSQSHLQLHRRSQGDECYPFRISSSTGVGRFVVASRDISEGEVVFEDDPLVVGPNHETVPLCLACLAEIRASIDIDIPPEKYFRHIILCRRLTTSYVPIAATLFVMKNA